MLDPHLKENQYSCSSSVVTLISVIYYSFFKNFSSEIQCRTYHICWLFLQALTALTLKVEMGLPFNHFNIISLCYLFPRINFDFCMHEYASFAALKEEMHMNHGFLKELLGLVLYCYYCFLIWKSLKLWMNSFNCGLVKVLLGALHFLKINHFVFQRFARLFSQWNRLELFLAKFLQASHFDSLIAFTIHFTFLITSLLHNTKTYNSFFQVS